MPPSDPTPFRRLVILAAAAIALFAWAGHYWISSELGVFADDFERVVPAFDAPFEQPYSDALHPLAGRLVDATVYAVFRPGRLSRVYAVGFFWLLLSGVLVCVLAARLSGRFDVGLAAGAAYVLFPADQMHPLLAASLRLQPAMLAVLLAIWLYARGRRVPAYLVAAASLLLSDIPYPLFLAAPLLATPAIRIRLRRLALHVGITLSVLTVVVLVRGAVGVAGPDGWSWKNALLGPLAALRETFTRPWGVAETVLHFPGVVLLVFLAATAAFLFVGTLENNDGRASRGSLTRVALAGLALLPLGYLRTGRFETAEVMRFVPGTHVAAGLGAALLLACLAALVLDLGRRLQVRLEASLFVAVLVAAGVVSGLAVQSDYRQAWEYERGFWTDAVRLCEDAGNNTLIVLDYRYLKRVPRTPVMDTYILDVLSLLHKFPANWDRPPVLTNLIWNWRQRFAAGLPLFDYVDWHWRPPDYYERYRDAGVIWLDVRHQKLRRLTGAREIRGRRFSFRERTAPVLGALPRRPLYGLLIAPPGAPPIDYAW